MRFPVMNYIEQVTIDSCNRQLFLRLVIMDDLETSNESNFDESTPAVITTLFADGTFHESKRIRSNTRSNCHSNCKILCTYDWWIIGFTITRQWWETLKYLRRMRLSVISCGCWLFMCGVNYIHFSCKSLVELCSPHYECKAYLEAILVTTQHKVNVARRIRDLLLKLTGIRLRSGSLEITFFLPFGLYNVLGNKAQLDCWNVPFTTPFEIDFISNSKCRAR